MQNTTNYNLNKPDNTDNYDVVHQNSNMEIIDGQMKANADSAIAAQNTADAAETPAGAQAKVDTHANKTTDAHDASAISVADIAANFTSTDVEGALAELFQKVSSGKTTIAAAIADMGQTALGSYTFAQLDAAIRDISNEATALTGEVLIGETFYQGGIKRTGTMPNNGAEGGTITTQGGSIVIPAGYTTGGNVEANISNLIAANIKDGVNVGGIVGTFSQLANGATAAQILTTRSAAVNGAIVNGSMPNRGTVNITPSVSNQAITSGYHSGAGVVYGDADLVASKIKSGANIFNVAGSVVEATGGAADTSVLSGQTFSRAGAAGRTGTMPNRGGATTVTPSTVNQVKSYGYYSGNITVLGDPDLVAGNILSGKNIFGVAGNVTPEKYASGSITSNSEGYMTISGIGFLPKVITVVTPYPEYIVFSLDTVSPYTYSWLYSYYVGATGSFGTLSTTYNSGTSGNWWIVSGSFKLGFGSPNTTNQWKAWG